MAALAPEQVAAIRDEVSKVIGPEVVKLQQALQGLLNEGDQ